MFILLCLYLCTEEPKNVLMDQQNELMIYSQLEQQSFCLLGELGREQSSSWCRSWN